MSSAETYDTGPLSHESTRWTSFQPFYGLSAEHIDNAYSISDLPIDAIPGCGLVDQSVLKDISGQQSQSSGSPYFPGLGDANLIAWSQCGGPGFQALNQPVNQWPVILGLGSTAFGAPYEDHWQYPVVPTPHQAVYDHAQLLFKPSTQSIDQGSFGAQLYSHGLHGSSPSTYPDLGSLSQYHTLPLSCSLVESLSTRPLTAGTCCADIQASNKDEILVDTTTAKGINAMTSFAIVDAGQSSGGSTPSSIGSSPGPDMLNCPACGRFQGDVRRLRFVTVPIVHWQQTEMLIVHREHMRCHMKPHICDVCECGRRFSTSRDLKRHQESAHRKSTLECHICFRKFGGKRADNLQRHLQAKHPDAMYEGPLPFGSL
ncbi:hypothetical protein CTA2_8177 [Colletotrichum tanaceti]|uniref:C2H2-type domain-containing protein n=1 Tax=Colletotrichum tanaceti TaxID=1306861 RepID=A0A4V6DHA9_9PEZI|nr:hypothetical protein CTA2_8186 [Colletotrichum tanaceti]KAJ0168250.1 hypothetical protein CTA2_8177 [Colletotrichum tanaceti]TKW55926.1 hypothetical protein CTA1_10943 [Colletotrichum tanaceti]